MRLSSFSLSKKMLFLFVCLVLFFTVYWFDLNILIKNVNLSEWLRTIIDKITWQGDIPQTPFQQIVNAFVLFLILAVGTSCGLPRQIAALVAGINFGAFVGGVLATLAVTLGCCITFNISRYALSQKINKKYPSEITKLSDFINDQTFVKTFIIRILPIGSNFLTNVIAGVTQVSSKAFIGGSFVGFIPQMVIFSLAGSGIRLGAKNEMIASGVLFIIALVLSSYLIRKRKRQKKGNAA